MDGRYKDAWRGVQKPAAESTGPLAFGTADVAFVAAGATGPGRYGALQWRGRAESSKTLHIGQRQTSGGAFDNNYIAVESLTRMKYVVLTYGTGSALHVVYTDLRSGSYVIPPCENIQAEIVVADTVDVKMSVAMALTEGEFDAADSPTFTTQLVADAVPPHARAVELVTPGTLVVDGKTVAVSDWTVVPAVQGPPTSPVRVFGGQYAFTRAAGSTLGYDMLRFWLAL